MKFNNIISKSNRTSYYICKCIECGNQYEIYLSNATPISAMYCNDCKTLPNIEPTQEILKKFFVYNPVTGDFIRRLPTSTSTKVGEIATNKNMQGYLTISWNGKHYLAHRLAWLYIYMGNFRKIK